MLKSKDLNTYKTDDETLLLGIDVGSTTSKIVLFENGNVVFERYERHFSLVRQKTLEMIKDVAHLIGRKPIKTAISGSAGWGLAKSAGIPFVQEVYATGETIKQLEPDTSVVIELGGEDAKVIFLKGGTDERMNGSCAGGTGAFIDQMSTLLNVTPDELDELSLKYNRLYPIASRCGVFAKSDIQPLLNQGANKADISASIYQAVVNQTIAGLAQGRKIEGKVVFLGGPLFYCMGLRNRFTETLKLSPEDAIFPDYSRFAVAIGAAIFAQRQDKTFSYDELLLCIENATSQKTEAGHLKPLFENQKDYESFTRRHNNASVNYLKPDEYSGKAFLGIDCGSTTTKLVLTSEDGSILYSYYSSNLGNPVDIIKNQLTKIYKLCSDRIHIHGSAVTGYGEELIKHAFGIDSGIVETIAHFKAAKHFNPNVDFILDIGGQDIKCFKVRNDAIDSIMLNEACSSGCGSFIETFAKSMGYDIEEFSRLGLLGKAPVDLGSRCTVFMNSSVKQAQKDGASVEDISAGLSVSVVKNAVYKVIRAKNAGDLGQNIVVQGGTFLNDAVLRGFECETGRNVTRPDIAGLMGAYGAALHAKSLGLEQSEIIKENTLSGFSHTSKAATCKGCGNNCRLTVNTFGTGEKYISGNQCEKGLGIGTNKSENIPNLYEFKRNFLISLPETEGALGTIGLPLVLGMYELAPLWHGIFSSLGFKVVLSGFSSRALYEKGQYSIPSDTACYPAKIMHGHIEVLIEKKVDAIFYPSLTYNIDEKSGENNYNCPIVAYYSELLNANMESLSKTNFLFPYLNINNDKELVKELFALLGKHYSGITKAMIKNAVKQGKEAYFKWMESIRKEGEKSLEYARSKGMRIMILAGRPYHIDPEIVHGIDKLAASLGFAVLSEDSVFHLALPRKMKVLNQWTYHARLYRAAEYAASCKDTELVQLVSFGCGLDAITTDEVRAIMEKKNKLYALIKIDEITNLGAVKIRLRSLISALEGREKR